GTARGRFARRMRSCGKGALCGGNAHSTPMLQYGIRQCQAAAGRPVHGDACARTHRLRSRVEARTSRFAAAWLPGNRHAMRIVPGTAIVPYLLHSCRAIDATAAVPRHAAAMTDQPTLEHLTALFNQRAWPQALALARTLKAALPPHPMLYYIAGIDSLGRAATMAPDNAEFAVHHAKALVLARRTRDARQEADRALALAPGRAQTL